MSGLLQEDIQSCFRRIVSEHNCMRNNFVFLDLVGRATRYGGISSYLDADIHKVDIQIITMRCWTDIYKKVTISCPVSQRSLATGCCTVCAQLSPAPATPACNATDKKLRPDILYCDDDYVSRHQTSRQQIADLQTSRRLVLGELYPFLIANSCVVNFKTLNSCQKVFRFIAFNK